MKCGHSYVDCYFKLSIIADMLKAMRAVIVKVSNTYSQTVQYIMDTADQRKMNRAYMLSLN